MGNINIRIKLTFLLIAFISTCLHSSTGIFVMTLIANARLHKMPVDKCEQYTRQGMQ